MKSRILRRLLLAGSAALLTIIISGCSKQSPTIRTDLCTVVIERGSDFSAVVPVKTVERGGDVTFDIKLYYGGMISSVDYEDHTLVEGDGSARLTLHNVRYSTVVSLSVSHEYVRYDANGGTPVSGTESVVRVPVDFKHLRLNTARGTELFRRDGYVLTGWNTRPDGSGLHVGLGSRIAWTPDLMLYAEWAEYSPQSDFSYVSSDGMVFITGYSGSDAVCVVPEYMDGLPVTKIYAYAFADAGFSTLVLPPTIIEIEKNAFCQARLEELYCYDSFNSIHNDSFAGCGSLMTLHINAVKPPSYSGTYFDTFTDKFDRLIALRDEPRIVLFSGSSARFGYDSPMIDQAFPEYGVVNMGVYAYTNALPQLRLIQTQMRPGDILVDAPEFDTIETQFCVTAALDKYLFCMAESNYDLISLLDLRDYTNVFSSFGVFLNERSLMEGKDYSVSARNFDEDGNSVSFDTYNEYGDYIFPRPNGTKEAMLRFIRTDYTVNAFPKPVIDSFNEAMLEFQNAGITVYVSYAPRNISSLTEESTPQARAELHTYLSRKLSAPLISEMEDYLYSAIYFYEIDNHLSDEGVQIRTEQIINDLKKVIES